MIDADVHPGILRGVPYRPVRDTAQKMQLTTFPKNNIQDCKIVLWPAHTQVYRELLTVMCTCYGSTHTHNTGGERGGGREREKERGERENLIRPGWKIVYFFSSRCFHLILLKNNYLLHQELLHSLPMK